jgi:hypothetical protein
VDGDEFTGPVKASELDGVLAVVLPTLARSHRDERRSHHVTLVAPIGELTVKDVARTAGLVAGADHAPPAPALEKAGVAEHGDHHGILVDIHPDPDDRRRHGLALLSVATLSVACGTGANSSSGPLTHGNPIRLGQPFHIF